MPYQLKEAERAELRHPADVEIQRLIQQQASECRNWMLVAYISCAVNLWLTACYFVLPLVAGWWGR